MSLRASAHSMGRDATTAPARATESPIIRAIPERIHLSLSPPPADGDPLPLASRRMWPLGLFFGGFFVVFAWIALGQVRMIDSSGIEDVFDLTVVLFQAFWILGWSVGVVLLGGMTVLFLLYRESARLTAGHLMYVPRLGPLHVVMSYDLGRIENLRLDQGAGKPEDVRIRFDYGGGTVSLGNEMSRTDAGRVVSAIQNAAAARASSQAEAAALLPGVDVTRWFGQTLEKRLETKEGAASTDRVEAPAWSSTSVLALLLANLVPLVGVLGFGWDLGQIMVLFWAESGIIGFYSLLRLCWVAGWSAIFLGPFFLAHFGGFMVGHFLFIYTLFIQGVEADGTVGGGTEAGLLDTLGGVFLPIYPALLALFLSHGTSFVTNFLGKREYAGRDPSDQMKEPYRRIMVMHVTIIFGGWLILALGMPTWALVLLVGLKTAVDLAAHRKEHGGEATGR